jgi:hypothetical protein
MRELITYSALLALAAWTGSGLFFFTVAVGVFSALREPYVIER